MRRKYAIPTYAAFYIGAIFFLVNYILFPMPFGRDDLQMLLAALCGILGGMSHYTYLWRNHKK